MRHRNGKIGRYTRNRRKLGYNSKEALIRSEPGYISGEQSKQFK